MMWYHEDKITNTNHQMRNNRNILINVELKWDRQLLPIPPQEICQKTIP